MQLARPQFDFAPPVGIAESVMGAFHSARQAVFAEADMQRQSIQEDKDRHYLETVVRPMQEEQAKIKLLNQQLNLKGTKLRLSQNRMAHEQQLSQIQMQDSAIAAVDAIRRRVGAHLGEATAPAGQGGGSIGKITSYGYSNDETPDSNSSAGIGAFVSREEQARIKAGEMTPNRLRPGDLAVSPDIRKKFSEAGIKPGQQVTITYADGKTHTGRYMDHTADDNQAAKLGLSPLRGRFDIYSPDGKHPTDGSPIAAFQPAQTDGMLTPGGEADANNPLLPPLTPQGPPNTRALLDDYDDITRTEQDPIVARNPLALANLRATKAHIERTPQFQALIQQRQQEQQDIALGELAREAITFTPPDQIADFKVSQPGAFAVLQRWDAGMPVTPREKTKALELLERHGQAYDPSKLNPQIAAAQKAIAENEEAIIRANAILTHTPPDSADLKDKQARQQARIDIEVAKYKIASALPLVPQAAQRYAPPSPPPTAQTDQTDPPNSSTQPAQTPAPATPQPWQSPAERPKIQAQQQRQANADAAWTAAKNDLSEIIDENEMLGAAAAQAEGRKVETGEKVTGGDYTYSVTEDRIGTPSRALLIAAGTDPDTKKKIDGKEYTLEEILSARLEEIARQKGFGKFAQQQQPQPVGKIKSITPVN